jgi:hypothetical protein
VMAKRDPYHQSTARFVWCRCCRNDSCDVRIQIRRARHAGKREVHEAALEAPSDREFDAWASLLYTDHFPEGPAEAWAAEFGFAEPVTVPKPLATLADVA